MDIAYPAGPTDVPPQLTAPSARYRRQAWLTMAGLVVFIGVYFALAGWFGWTAYRLLAGLSNAHDDALLIFGAGVGSAFLAIFMIKALVFVKRGEAVEDLEVTEADEPQLFAFLARLADEVGAPRAHRVYLSGRVNAAVFYDLSLANLVLPSNKNLEIGLALVNVLNLGEFKAVLAHEFGHFAQKTMAVGRWVYVSQQIASHIVGRRDAFDAFLVRLSTIDFRVAWIAWVLRLIVWSIRAVIDLLFRIVVLAQRALSREMEFQADLVAVSVTGSDALIHALHRLGPADAAWSRSLAFASSEVAANRRVADLFAVQSRVIEQMRAVLDDEGYGVAPAVPADEAPRHRLFKAVLAAPPSMWATHPSNCDREDNAKRVFVRAAIDERSAWSLFADPPTLRRRASTNLIRSADLQAVPIEESLKRLDAEYARPYLDRAYRGTYIGRSIVRSAETVEELYGPPPDDVLEALDKLYPESLDTDFLNLRELEGEKELLGTLRPGSLGGAGGAVTHRGERLSRKSLPGAIARVTEEINALLRRIREHDRSCRAAHRAAATTIDPAWVTYLVEQLRLLHFAEHTAAHLQQARIWLGFTIRSETARGKLRRGGLERILRAATAAFDAVKAVHDRAAEVVPDPAVLGRLGKESWNATLEELKLPPPTKENINAWLKAVDSWVNACLSALEALRLASLEELLSAESAIRSCVRDGSAPAAAPEPARTPAAYSTLLTGAERTKQPELRWWDRFHAASDAGPMAVRVLVAASIIGAVVWVGMLVGNASVFVFNGLGRPVTVQLGGEPVYVDAYSHREIDVPDRDSVHVVTRTSGGSVIEEFDAPLSGHHAHAVYYVAAAGDLVSWTALYGKGEVQPPKSLGAPRWTGTKADIVLDEPPRSVQTKGGSATRSVLTGLAGESPERVLAPMQAYRGGVDRIIELHARWDDSGMPHARAWIDLAAQRLPSFTDIVSARVLLAPADALNRQLEQVTTKEPEREAMCNRQRAVAAANPKNRLLQNVVASCGQPAVSR